MARSNVERLIGITEQLARAVNDLKFGPPVAHVYNPLDYARAAHEQYLRHYGHAPREVLLLGMNPGPFGMAQTGVPFGEVSLVRDWLGIDAPIGRPAHEHPKRPVLGFSCTRSEVSGARVWGWARTTFKTPDAFFARFFVINYCPLLFLEASGANFTPDKLPASQRAPLLEVCDRAFAEMVDYFAPRTVVGVGKFAEARAQAALAGTNIEISTIAHPSPANPAANRGWGSIATHALKELGLL